ncbi:hypothetical protein H6F88_17655 [Oculatella sp. FACHB-28]|uniref:hypothetical protein n=1 Tax=Cyanophyceae TaxID=3028117 RepID=UPI0016899267|nr:MULTISPECIES: hypothetical protein [Cyanophyceae]MBD1998446.1 hypothetical protein [Leptolyngbya sp. FACHB-541]MBD2057822.1 hypothetical protein [Oculatella sp. FACHB-28]
MDPATALAASAIAKLAFDEFVKSGAGELAKKSLEATGSLVKSLRDKIQAKFKGNSRAEAALVEVETQGTPATLDKVSKYLDLEMMEDEAFAADIRQVAQQIINIQNQSVSNRAYSNYGRDQINIETIQGNPTIGGS